MPASKLLQGLRTATHSQDEYGFVHLCPAGGTGMSTKVGPKPGWAFSVLQQTEEYSECLNMVQVIVDMMAGIGPFAVPAAQRGCQVGSLKYCILAQSDSRLTEVAEEACLQMLTIFNSGLGGPDALLPERLRSHWIYQDS